MRHSELALVVARLRIGAEPYHLLIKHSKWGDWSFVGGHVEADERNDWARAAVRECNEELAPLEFGEHFTLIPMLDQPLRWGPVVSQSSGSVPTMYTAQVFALRFLKPPGECLAKLPADQFRLVRESTIMAEGANRDAITARTLGRVDRRAVAWDKPFASLPLQANA